jgi:NADH dehydrogenase [ubiquinone] 1 alpha subcomplex assembly factor 1
MTLTLFLSIVQMFLNTTPKVLIEFSRKGEVEKWQVVDDRVMGGLSRGLFHLSTDSTALFEGNVSTENNGGFSSVRTTFQTEVLREYAFFILRIKGDGKKYQFRVKVNASDSFSYITEFQTTGGWEDIEIPFDALYPSYRGQRLNRSNFSGDQIEEMAFLAGNKRTERFRLEVDRIAVR